MEGVTFSTVVVSREKESVGFVERRRKRSKLVLPLARF